LRARRGVQSQWDHGAVLFELSDVTLSRGGEEVLQNVSAGLPAGSTAVVGPSGAGKSTLLRLLDRLADPDTGTISFNGRELSDYDPLELRREVALVPQLPALLEGTVESNLAYAAGLAGREPECGRCLELAGLDQSFAARDVGRLSVGEQQRAMLARALTQEPKVLLLDEPTSALDERTRAGVEATIARLVSDLGVSAVIVTHDRGQAKRLARRTVELRPA
jgi:putative ABC transport system ATP-binding protein